VDAYPHRYETFVGSGLWIRIRNWTLSFAKVIKNDIFDNFDNYINVKLIFFENFVAEAELRGGSRTGSGF
jgi:hypothetical protein